jgi:hypothetical protein
LARAAELRPRPPCIHAKQGFSLHFFNKINKQKNALSQKKIYAQKPCRATKRAKTQKKADLAVTAFFYLNS